jgi:acyl transferase domain-containing protein
LEDAALVICSQARLFSRLEGQGAMALIASSEAEVRELIAGTASAIDAEETSVAALHGAAGCVISGPHQDIAALLARARAQGVFAAPVRSEVAFHSPAAARLCGRLRSTLAQIAPRAAHTPMLSSVHGAWLRGPECDAAYWAENQRAPVRFAQALAALDGQGPWAALELAPHALLARELRAGLSGSETLVLPSLVRGAHGRGSLLQSAAQLFEASIELDLGAVARGARPAPRLPEAARRHLPLSSSAEREPASSPLTLPLAAHTPEALRALAGRYHEQLSTRSDLALEDIVYKAASARTQFSHRLAVTGSSRLSLCEALAAYARGDHAPGLVSAQASAAGGCVFVFSGHGSQWPGMCAELLAHEPVFREVIERCEQLFERHGVHGLRAQLRDDRSPAPSADKVQPRLFAVQVGLAALWRSWGVEPAALIGHSVGEIAAARVAGCLDLESAARVVCERARAIRPAIGRGGMLLVELASAEAQKVAELYPGQLSVAVHHSARFSVLSGAPQALDEVTTELIAREVFCRRVAVDYASHGPEMVELSEQLERSLSGLSSHAPRVALMSTCEAGWLKETDACGPAYWARNLREPVRFVQAVQQLLDAGFDSFLELSPHPLLVNALQEIGAQRKRSVSVLFSLRRNAPEHAALREALSGLFCNGHGIDWSRQLASGGDLRVPLPTYPFQRVRHWKSVTACAFAEPSTGVVRKLPPSDPEPPPTSQVLPLSARLGGASGEQRRGLLRAMLVRELAYVLRADSAQLDPELPFSALGLDSLLGLELRNRIEAETGVAVPGTLLWSRPSVSGLEQYLLERVDCALSTPKAS